MRNASAGEIRYGGTACSACLARAVGDGWEVFAFAPGNLLEVAQRLRSGERCEAWLGLAGFSASTPDGSIGPVELEAGTAYRVVFLASRENGGTGVGHAPLTVG